MSGGLDSTLAVCVLREQGLHVEGVVFSSPFFSPAAAQLSARQLGVPLHVLDFTTEILSLVEKPPHGFGGCLNPCIDCHLGMIRRAGELAAQMGFDFVASGEVLGQRPMSQNRHALGIVATGSGWSDRLVRPLSAQLMEPTRPELEGLIDRSRLLGLSGRSRKPQIELAAKYGVTEYPSPAGGCLLTEEGFCRRLADLRSHEGLGNLRLVHLLRAGRHFRLPGGAKCIAGRSRADNETLRTAAGPADVVLCTVNVPGPTLLLPGGAGEEDIQRAAGICVAYGDRHQEPVATVVRVVRPGGSEERPVEPLAREVFQAWML
jgi:hypothetical protein